MKRQLTLLVIFSSIIYISSSNAQEIKSRVLDSVTKQPVPFATVILKNKGTVSNSEGVFSFIYKKNFNPNDTLKISCIGYKTIAKPLHQFKDSIVFIAPQTNKLKEVILTNKNYTTEEIIEKVEENLATNYNKGFTNKKLFFRESNFTSLLKSNYKLKKSTIPELNEKLLDTAIGLIPRESSYYTEVLCNLYGNLNAENQKINLIKASEMYDKDNEISLTGIEKKFTEIIEKNVKKDSYFKIKSGLFGQKVEMDDFVGEKTDSSDVDALKSKIEEQKKKELDKKKNYANYRKQTLINTYNNLFFKEDTKLNFISKSNRYKFGLEGITYYGDQAVYVITFEPKRRETYKGTLYIDINDFAIVRVDYENVKPLKTFKLLGISYNNYLSKGKMIFSKDNDSKYNLKYIEIVNANKFGIKRPLKIIEKNKNVRGRRKQNELSLKIDFAINNSDKKEIVIFDTNTITSSEYEKFKEKNTVLPVYQTSYNPEFWKGYNIIEPNKAIRDFTVVE